MSKLAEIMTNSEWSPGVRSLIEFHLGRAGGFTTALWRAISAADESSLQRLALGFPNEVQAFRRWRDGDLRQRLQAAGLEI